MERDGALEIMTTGPLGLPAIRVPVTTVAKAPAAWPYTDDGSSDGPASATPPPDDAHRDPVLRVGEPGAGCHAGVGAARRRLTRSTGPGRSGRASRNHELSCFTWLDKRVRLCNRTAATVFIASTPDGREAAQRSSTARPDPRVQDFWRRSLMIGQRFMRGSARIAASAMAIGLLAATVPLGASAQSTPEPAADCARSDAENAMQMWERSGGNKGMVDILVCAWNEANPDRPINLSYIVHTEMVAKIAQGDRDRRRARPDGHGPHLRARSSRTPASWSTSPTSSRTSPRAGRPRAPATCTVATYNDRLYGVPLYADVSALFYNKDLFKKAGLDPDKPPTSLAELGEYADQDHGARRRHQGLLPARQLRGLQHLHGRPADVGLRRHHRGRHVR